ncbi:GRF zinc finger family protein [Striga asiatica]|uniref:GRF zinc finger family protein n=1 Tax=Striga asiatica TaxID=4170 RepID=A0A5A7QNK6_STRAF|nr:GRF zinc finger family protein [Striga asiatica]
MSESSHYTGFLECRCRKMAVIRTSWTADNPGRRFHSCLEYKNGGCDFFSWVDPPTCDRPEKIMPGLVKKMKALERANENFKFENTKLEEKVEKLEEKIEKLQKKVEKLQALNKRLVEKKEKMEMKMGFALAIAALLCVFLLYKIR